MPIKTFIGTGVASTVQTKNNGTDKLTCAWVRSWFKWCPVVSRNAIAHRGSRLKRLGVCRARLTSIVHFIITRVAVAGLGRPFRKGILGARGARSVSGIGKRSSSASYNFNKETAIYTHSNNIGTHANPWLSNGMQSMIHQRYRMAGNIGGN